MRIIELELEGFGPFRDAQTVRFDAAAAGGILLISGPTGSGKSSLLDAVSFALYGAVPRYSGQPHRVRSHHLAPDRPTRVRLDFEMAGSRYRIERKPEWQRPKRRGEGTTTQAQEARLWAWDEESNDWDGVASRPTDVAAALGPIIGLTHVQFLQVVLLAQGGFQKFLHADDQERGATLRTLFQTGRFDDIERQLVERRQALSRATEQAEHRLEHLLTRLEHEVREARAEFAPAEETAGTEPKVDGEEGAAKDDGEGERATADSEAQRVTERQARIRKELDWLDQRARDLVTDAQRAENAREEADTRVRHTRVIADRQTRRADAERQRENLRGRSDEIEQDRAVLAAAARAAAALPHIERENAARANVETARAAEARARDTVARALDELLVVPDEATPLTVREPEEPTVAQLRTRREALARSRVQLEGMQRTEDAVSALESETQKLRNDREATEQEVQKATRRSAELPEQLAEMREKLQRLSETAALGAGRAEAVDRAETVLDAARTLEKITPEHTEAQKLAVSRANEAAKATQTFRELIEQRMRGMAGELAEGLRTEEPCPVCGSTDHPNPAQRSDRVTSETLEAAKQDESDALDARDAALDRERELQAEIAALRARTDGNGVESAEAQLRTAAALRAESDSASDAVAEARADVERIERELKETAAAEREARDTLITLDNHIRANDAAVERQRAEVDAARGAYPTIAARIKAETNARDAIDQLIEEIQHCEAATRTLDEATREMQKRLAEHGFSTAEAASDASRSETTRADLQERLDAYDADLARISGILAELELQHLPGEPVPLDAHEEAYRRAREQAAHAQTAVNTIERVRRDCGTRFGELERETEASAAASARLLKLRRLVDTVQGKDPNTRKMRLETFVLAARLEAIVTAANRRLERMVGGRYTLEHDDALRSHGRQSGLGLRVMDAYTGTHRSPASLSGGETFLASLALALGLADVVAAEAGGIALDTLFVDEGFGSLDPDALDHAMATLDGLREGGRSVVLISHVAEMKERIPAQLEVVVDGNGVSTLRGDGVPPGRK